MHAEFDATRLPRSPIAAVLNWTLCVLAAAIFLFASFLKLTGEPQAVTEFSVIDLGQGFRYFTGLIELVGGLLLLVPSRSWAGAVLLLGVDLGAFVAQIRLLHQNWIHTVVIAIVLLGIIGLERPRLPGLRLRPGTPRGVAASKSA